MKSYSQYTEDDFIMDTEFQEWVKNPSTKSDIFWYTFLEQYPAKRDTVDRARALLLAMSFNNNLLEVEKEVLWDEIASQTVRKQAPAKVISLKRKRFPLNKVFYASAAVIFACTLTVILVYLNKETPKRIVSTGYGQVSTILLPDNSTVTLNASSSITYTNRWDDHGLREVWVDGEAFFSVKHTATNQPFIVHTAELDIEVLGTEFNVLRREGTAKVSLNSGKIKLQVLKAPEPVLMKAGDILEVASSKVVRKSGNVEHLSIWKDKRLIFDDTPLSEIMTKLKYMYGWEYEKVDEDLLVERLSGEVETSDETKLLRTLEKAFRVVITKKGNTVSISRI